MTGLMDEPNFTIYDLLQEINILQNHGWDAEQRIKDSKLKPLRSEFNIVAAADAVGGYANWDDNLWDAYNLFFEDSGEEKPAQAVPQPPSP